MTKPQQPKRQYYKPESHYLRGKPAEGLAELQSFACWIAGKEDKKIPCGHCNGTGMWKIEKFSNYCEHCNGRGYFWHFAPDYRNNATALLDDVLSKVYYYNISYCRGKWTVIIIVQQGGGIGEPVTTDNLCLSSLKALAQTPLWDEYMTCRSESEERWE